MQHSISQYPTLNPIQMFPVEFNGNEVRRIPIPSQYHTLPIDKQSFSQSIRDWQTEKCYKQKIQQDDIQHFVFNVEQPCDMYLYIYDVNGNLVENEIENKFVIYNANSYYDTGTEEVPTTIVYWRFRFSDFGLDDGVYYVIARIRFYEGETLVDTKYYGSEALDVKEDHPGTVLIQAWNETNKADIVFNYDTTQGSGYTGDFFVTPKFPFRVEGAILDPEYKRESTDFTEQDREVRNLNSKAILIHPLYIGEATNGEAVGIPPYLMDKLNAALACDVIMIEGRRYSVDTNAEWEKNEAETYPLYTGKINLVDYDYRDKITDYRGARVRIATGLDTLPNYVVRIGMLDKSTNIGFTIAQGWFNSDSGNVDDLEGFLNTDAKDANGLEGEFILEDGNIDYQNAPGESYVGLPEGTHPVTNTVVLFTLAEFTVVTSSSNQTFAFKGRNMVAGIYWGDNSNENYIHNVNSFPSSNITHTFATAGTYTVLLFTANISGVGLIVSGNTFTGSLRNITGNLPALTTYLSVSNANFSAVSGGFSLEILANCRRAIQFVEFRQCQIAALDGNVFDDYPRQTDPLNWRLLNFFSLVNNTLDSTEISDMLIAIYNKTPHIGPGTINLSNPGATFTGINAPLFKTLLTNSGWSVYP